MTICSSCNNLLDIKSKVDEDKKTKKSKLMAFFYCPTCGTEEPILAGSSVYSAFYLSSGEEIGMDAELIIDDPINELTNYLQCSNSKCKASKNSDYQYAFTIYKHPSSGRVYYFCQTCKQIVSI